LENVLFTGYVDQEDIVYLYKMADVFVFPSLYEGFGIPPIEAMMTETPVIASGAASLPEICGDAALYADVSNPSDLAEKIYMVLSDGDLKSSLITKGKLNVLRFPLKEFEQNWQKIINEIL
jgi:glycosyltransferase involved in cell wall biosynthesis